MALSKLAGDFGRESLWSLQWFFSSQHAPMISTSSYSSEVWRTTKGEYLMKLKFPASPMFGGKHVHWLNY